MVVFDSNLHTPTIVAWISGSSRLLLARAVEQVLDDLKLRNVPNAPYERLVIEASKTLGWLGKIALSQEEVT